MPLNVVFLRPQNWSRLKPYYSSTITAVKGFREPEKGSDFLFPLQPPHPDKPPGHPNPESLILVHFGSVSVRLASVRVRLGPFRVRFGPFGAVRVCLGPFRVCFGLFRVLFTLSRSPKRALRQP